ncbi:hypothetical protein SLA2020_451200 [Shorea laevis]
MESKRRIQKLSFTASSGFNLFENLMLFLNDEDLAVVILIARRIWMRRNSFLFEGTFTPPAQVVQQGLESLAEFLSARASSVPLRQGSMLPRGQRWTKPSVGMAKVNWDAALDSQSKRMGVGMIIRDASGSVLASMCTFIRTLQILLLQKPLLC